MPISFKFIAKKNERINSFLLKEGFSSSNIYNLIKQNHVLVNNIVIRGRNYLIHQDDVIDVTLNDETNDLFENENPINICYEDEYILIVNKPYGLDVEPSLYSSVNNLSSQITHYYKINNIKSKIHLVNRLDKYTTGLVIVAKNQFIKNKFSKTKIIKKYLCLVKGKTKEHEIIVNRILKDPLSNKRIIVNEGGKICKTEYRLIKYENDNSLLEVTLHTGRTHQIRATLANINHPLINDPLYNDEVNGDMFLKAYYLKLIHPITLKDIEIKL